MIQLQGGPEKPYKDLLHQNFAIMRHSVTRFSIEYSEINK